MLTTQDIRELNGRDVHGTDGDKLGSVGDVYLDQQTGQPEWVAIKTGLFGTKLSFAPLAEARREGDDIVVPYSKDQIKDAPQVDADGELSHEEESSLYRHYGLEHGGTTTEAGPQAGETGTGTVGHDTSGPTTDDAMTRSEEELHVGTERHETGRARLRKYVVTEDVHTTVPVQREEVRVEREPITDANRDEALSGGDITEEEHEVTLHEERPVVEKEVVPKERVRLDTETVTDEVQVDDQVRKEQIESDGDGERR